MGLFSIPEGMAYAAIADVNPVAGLYAGVVPAIVGSLTFRTGVHFSAGSLVFGWITSTSTAAKVTTGRSASRAVEPLLDLPVALGGLGQSLAAQDDPG